MTTAPDLRTPLFAAMTWYADLVGGVRDDQLSDPTPCSDFDVRHLLAHMGAVFTKVTGFGTGHRDVASDHDLSEKDRAAAFEDRVVRTVDGRSARDQADSLRAELGRARAAWTDDVLDTPIALGWGPVLPGRIVAGIYLMEVLSHAWDLATATGQPAEAPDGLGDAGLQAAQAALPAEDREGFPFGPVVPSAPDAGPTERMANWTGRVSRA